MKTKTLFTVAFIFMLVFQLQAQLGNPYIYINLDHPPALGIKVSKVAFSNVQSECIEQIQDPVISDFVQNQVEVIDRANLNEILAEHDLSLSGYIDRTTAASIGKILGPSAMVKLKVLRCETVEKDNLYSDKTKTNYKTGNKYNVRTYISRVEFYLKVSVQVTDLTSATIFAAQTFDYTKQKENRSTSGRPESPSKYDVREMAYKEFAWDVHKLFFPWTEKAKLIYFDDKTCDLKTAYQLLSSGDRDGAYRKSLDNLNACRQAGAKAKFIAHAYYNVGMSHFINGEYDEAIEALLESQKIKDNAAVKNAIYKCRKARQLALMSTQFEERAELDAENAQAEQSANKKSFFTNDDVIKYTKSGFSDAVILKKIETSKCNFDTSSDEALLKLREAGVSDEVLMLMMEK